MDNNLTFADVLHKMFFLFLSIFAMASSRVVDGQISDGPLHGKVVTCSMISAAAHWPGLGQFTLKNLEPSLCTHIVYAFAGLDRTNYTIKSLDPKLDIEKDNGMAGYKGVVALKKRYPHLKVTIAIGGWSEDTGKYSTMVASPKKRKTFLNSVMTFLDHYKFDGLDLYWEYPVVGGGKLQDRENFVLLVKELREAFESRGFLLSAALGAGQVSTKTIYDVVNLAPHLHLIYLMTYNYHGFYDNKIRASAPLRPTNTYNERYNVGNTVREMLSLDVPPSKLVLGIPLFGNTYIIKNQHEKNVVIGQTYASKETFEGPYTKDSGHMGYNEICQERSNKTASWTYHWDNRTETPLLRDGKRVIIYDDARSIASKVKLAVDNGFAGVLVWSVDRDDFLGKCSPPEDPYVDFSERLNKIVNNSLLPEALKNLPIRDEKQIDPLSKGPCYVKSNGTLILRLPKTDKILNYKLLRTINDAIILATQEKKIMNELERLKKENETTSGSGRLGTNLGSVLCLLLISVRI